MTPVCSSLSLSKDTAELFFEDVRLPSGALLGEVNRGFFYLMNELPQVKTGQTNGEFSCRLCSLPLQWHFAAECNSIHTLTQPLFFYSFFWETGASDNCRHGHSKL